MIVDLRALLWWLIILQAVVLIVCLFAIHEVRAHDWYEPACCSDKDCKPVEEGTVIEKPDGYHVRGHGVLSRSDPRLRWSRDERDHVCEQVHVVRGVRPDTSVEMRKLMCVYRRHNGM